MTYGIIFGSAGIAGILSVLVSLIISKKQDNLKYITNERKEWREKIRDIASKLHNANYNRTLYLLTELKVRINAMGNGVFNDYKYDAHIWEIVNFLEIKEPEKNELKKQQNLLINYLSLLLKDDWERTKNEVKGDIYLLVSISCYVLLVVFFSVSVYIQYNAESNIFDISRITFLNITTIIITVVFVLFSKCIDLIFSKGNLNDNTLKHNFNVSILGLNVVYGITIIIFMFIYFFLLKLIFVPLNIKNEIVIYTCIILYTATLYFLYNSNINAVIRKINYNHAIKVLRTKNKE